MSVPFCVGTRVGLADGRDEGTKETWGVGNVEGAIEGIFDGSVVL